MNRIALLVLALLPLAAAGQTMYKWVDEKGVTHFSESPPPDGKAAKIEVKPVGNEAPRSDDWKQRDLESRQRRAAKEAADSEVQKREQQMRGTRCSTARSELDGLKNARRVYKIDAKGERVYTEDAERPALIERWEQEARKYCD
jgi:hypothetical protein